MCNQHAAYFLPFLRTSHGRFKPNLHPFIQNGTCILQKSTVVQRQVKLGGARAASIDVVTHDLIKTPALKFGTFGFAWTILDDLYIGGQPEENM